MAMIARPSGAGAPFDVIVPPINMGRGGGSDDPGVAVGVGTCALALPLKVGPKVAAEIIKASVTTNISLVLLISIYPGFRY